MRAVGAPRLAVENADAVVEGSSPKPSGFIYDKGIGVIVTEAVFLGVVGVLLVSGCGGVVLPDAFVFGADPDGVVCTGAEGSNELALRVGIP